MLTGDCVRWLVKGWEGKEREWGNCVDNILCKGDWIKDGKGREWGNCVLTGDCVRGLDKGVMGREGSGGIVC